MSAMPPIDEPLLEPIPGRVWFAIGSSFAAIPAIVGVGVTLRGMLWGFPTPVGLAAVGIVSEVLMIAGFVIALRFRPRDGRASRWASWATAATTSAVLLSTLVTMVVATFGDPAP